VHTGERYHKLILASKRAQWTRARFQQMALGLLPAGAPVLDFGAGTGIDAKAYAAAGHPVSVHEPSGSMRAYLARHCREEIASGRIITMPWPAARKVRAITADFAVLNHFADHELLFQEFADATEPGGFVLASMLSPWFMGDARYGWWWMNLIEIARSGRSLRNGESGVHRFTPRAVARAAAPHFRMERVAPRGLGLATQLYMFLLLRRV
jgi:SAM-dependent methyltransferase